MEIVILKPVSEGGTKVYGNPGEDLSPTWPGVQLREAEGPHLPATGKKDLESRAEFLTWRLRLPHGLFLPTTAAPRSLSLLPCVNLCLSSSLRLLEAPGAQKLDLVIKKYKLDSFVGKWTDAPHD